ncbi:N-acyl homoserine lactonase family protein [Lactobacillus johnsonii]|uniref:N-acyl homoserine lactonase family protein n=1 Tax=Lactobacillus johnsonii TaxID=33959 RepID=UPI0028ED893D|nr:N-acyl homoserine lactonase family protein [Lactobacillus johnsonii]MDT9605170.1 N-acyl homoserine lactonase family protein [Lactobacillus johnsonii]
MSNYKITMMHTGKVRIEPELAFGGDHCSTAKAAGFTIKRSPQIWLPVSVFLVETPNGLLLLDTGWDRSMSPNGIFDKKAQIKSLGSRVLYHINQGVVPKGMTASEQLASMGIKPEDIDYVVISHLDCDHANGLRQFKNAKHIMVAKSEYEYAKKHEAVRFKPRWWKGLNLDLYDWNDTEGPFKRSYDLFGDKSVELINIPGHTAGLVATKITDKDGKYFLYYGDGGYGEKSWKEMITSGISMNKSAQKKSLEWIREQSMDSNCVESDACHGAEVKPHIIEF